MSEWEIYKRQAAEAALEEVRSGMLLGLGTGSTAYYVTLGLAERLRQGLLNGIKVVPTSEATARLAQAHGLPLAELPPEGVDLSIDGADEIAPDLSLIKGLGGALLREKIVEAHSRRAVVVVDASKLVEVLGRGVLPLEVAPFGYRATLRRLASFGEPTLRHTPGGEPFRSDGGNWVVDLKTGPISDPWALEAALRRIPGIFEVGLFLGIAQRAYVAGPGGLRVLERP
jgi:ribose 5-phosphate isomerase A